MTTKLTLSMDNEVISSAKKYAQGKGTSLSSLVENYLKSISGSKQGLTGISPRVGKLMGSIRLPKDFDYKTEIGKAINKNQ